LSSSIHRWIIAASDGIFEFITNQEVVDMIEEFPDPMAFCNNAVNVSWDRWMEDDDRTDDITIIALQLDIEKLGVISC
jgi:serine/threonine protein phosphatase PrpC